MILLRLLPGMGRRGAASTVTLLALALLHGTAAEAKNARPTTTVSLDAEVTEATWASLDISGNGKGGAGGRIVFDMLGDLYSLTPEGGVAERITSGNTMDVQPRFSPDGSTILFISDRDGGNGLWLADADGSRIRPFATSHDATFASPAWAADGKSVFAMRRIHGRPGPESEIVEIEVDGAIRTIVSAQLYPSGPAASVDGRWLYVATQWHTGRTRIERVALDSGEHETVIAPEGGAARPTLSGDGRWLAFGTRTDGGERLALYDLSAGTMAVTGAALYRDQQDNPLSDSDLLPGFAFSGDSRRVLYVTDGRFRSYDIATGKVANIPMHARLRKNFGARQDVKTPLSDAPVTLRMLRWHQLTADGRKLVFGAAARIFVLNTSDGSHRQLPTDMLAFSPAVSPDGRWLAFVGWSDDTLGAIYKTPLDRFDPVRLTDRPGLYEQLAWSAQGERLLFVHANDAQVRASPNLNESVQRSLGWIDARGGDVHDVLPLPPRGDRRPQMRPRFMPDGQSILFATTAKRRGGTVLERVRIDGSERQTLARMPFADDIVPSPDGERIGFTRHSRVFVAPMPGAAHGDPVAIEPGVSAWPVDEIGCGGADHIEWTADGSTLTWGWGPQFYRVAIDPAQPRECPEPLHTVRIDLPRAVAPGELWLTNAQIVTADDRGVIERGSIKVVDGRIAVLCENDDCTIPDSARQIDLSGATIMPGLVDAHAHYRQARNGDVFPSTDWGNRVQLAYGVTTARDPSARSQSVFTQAEMIETGLGLGPRMLSTGEPFYFQQTGFGQPPVSRKEVESKALRLKALGASALKQYILPRREQRRWLADVARETGLASIPEGAQKFHYDISLILDGYSTLEHMIKVAPLGQDVLALIAASGTPVVPTLMVGPSVDAQTYYGQRWDFAADARLARFLPPSIIAGVKGRGVPIEDNEPYFVALSRNGRRMLDAGGSLALGAHGDLPGLGAHWELWAMAMGGIDPLTAIEIATMGSAHALGVENDVGSLAPGKIADLVVLDADPLADLSNTLSIRFVMKHGQLWDAATMAEIWPEQRPAGRHYWYATPVREPQQGSAEEGE